ncbi:hypothetical protein FGG08_002453 [Glutinoglossum americanum]|uniref:Signal peptide peptidase n=1 Tax=Glutinoglossum americanum TaxID=1670608 RepID=A0A9P8IBK5_9PEZI|nr:hypothetical protein FGG08_002453 [Glutinoglossum americanum]
MSEPGPLVEFLDKIAHGFWEISPTLPTYLHIIAAALFPIYTGAHASLSRPASAADPKKRKKGTGDGSSMGEEDDTDEDENLNANSRMEGLSPMDAIMFPLLAGITLAGLYFLIKWMEDPELLNKLLTWYFSVLGIFSVGRLLGDIFGVLISFVFPSRWSDGQAVWRFKNAKKRAESRFPSLGGGQSPNENKFYRTHASPFPGLFSSISLPLKVNDAFWTVRIFLTEKWSLLAHSRGKLVMKLKFGMNDVAGLVIGFLTVGAYSLISKSWWLTNLMGFGFSYGALQLISPTTFWTGSLVLMALFLYDVYFVFFTPLMVTVAKSLDIPIKLLFPRPADGDLEPSLAMLGLGDIVLPGMMIGLALRYDLYLFYLRKQVKKTSLPEEDTATLNSDEDGAIATSIEIVKPKYFSAYGGWGERFWTRSHLNHTASKHAEGGRFPKIYFYSSVVGYVIGMLTTLGVMHFADHAQPALLYLVPGVLGALWGTALVRGEVGLMWNFSEAEGDDEMGKTSILSVETATKRAERAATNLTRGGADAEVSVEGENRQSTGSASRSGATRLERDREIFSLSLTAPPLNHPPGLAKASPKVPTLEDALREASELQLGSSTSVPISAEDFLSPGMHRRTNAPNIQKNAQPIEKRRRVV